MSTAIPANAASFTLAEVARATGGVAHGTVSVVGVSTDTRAVARGNLFVALRGANFDGHLFLKAAVNAISSYYSPIGRSRLYFRRGGPVT